MDTTAAAARWAQTWERAWPAGDVAAITALYAADATYRSSPFREPEDGGALGYVSRVFAEEADVTCWFASPMVDGRRASVEWWASFDEDGDPITLAGASVLAFDTEGLVVDHVDYWMQATGRHAPFAGWAGAAGRALSAR